MIELKYRQLKIIEIGEGDDSALLFGAFSRQNELLDVFQPAGLRWRRKAGETAADFEKRIISDMSAATRPGEHVD